MVHTYEATIGDRTLTVEVGRLAGQAGGAATVRYGDTMVLATACASPSPREGIDFFPLTIDIEERLYAVGKIPGSFFRREGRPSTDAVLAMRLTDRPIRPLFPKGFRNDVQVVITVLSADRENEPDILATIGASTALSLSDIPFQGPVSSVRVGYQDGRYVINPTFAQLKEGLLDLVVASTRDAVMMVEAGAGVVSEEVIVEALRVGHEANQAVIALQDQIVAELGKPKMPFEAPHLEAEVVEAVARFAEDRLGEVVSTMEKAEREEALAERREELLERLGEAYDPEKLLAALDAQVRQRVRSQILENATRPDGRDPTAIRPISAEVGVLPRTHGSGLFTRGETQVLTISTLGSMGDEQRLDTLSPEEKKRFLHHYNFPPFSVGEVRRIGTPSRRDIGHGALAERSLEPVIPSVEEFPYTIRLVSEVLSSNGSTSMASVCGSTLSLMDAGVPIKAPVAGVAMGLIMGEDGRYAVLTDIAGIEDALGDMDFKVAGTSEGITGLQMDIKVTGISLEIMERALAQAREARLNILGKMLETIPESRSELSPYAPRMLRLQISPDKIGAVIGPGGKMIRSIIEETKCSIDVEDDGTVYIGSADEVMARRAVEIIEGLTKEVEVGAIYTGKITRTINFGAFAEILPGREGLIHIAELADYRVPSVEDVVKVGDEVMVMVTEIDNLGRINLSRRAVLEGATSPPERTTERGGGPPRRGGGGGGGPRREREPVQAGAGPMRRRSDGRPLGGGNRPGNGGGRPPRQRPVGRGGPGGRAGGAGVDNRPGPGGLPPPRPPYPNRRW